MDRDLRASLIAACAAAALSALVGIVAGVGALTLLLRAVACGAAVGAATYGAIALLKRSLPGALDEREGAAGDAERAPGMGANVDIVLPGEDAERETAAPPAERNQVLEQALAERPYAGMEAEGFEPMSARRAPGDEEEAAFADEPSLLEAEEAPMEAEAAMPTEARAEGSRRSAVGFDDLDVLPDLEGFSDSFTASEFAAGGPQGERVDVPGTAALAGAGASAPRTAQGSVDSAALAQAVRTILKRDQKG